MLDNRQKTINDFLEEMRRSGYKIAFAESMTSGALVNEFARQLDIGDILIGSIVSYQAECKVNLLGVPSELIEKYTAESAEVTQSMTQGLIKLLKPDIAVAVTGLATEGGSETESKPVGSVFISTRFLDKIDNQSGRFFGRRDEIIMQTVNMIFYRLHELFVKGKPFSGEI